MNSHPSHQETQAADAFRTYGQHTNTCLMRNGLSPEVRCTCGFDKVREALAPFATPGQEQS